MIEVGGGAAGKGRLSGEKRGVEGKSWRVSVREIGAEERGAWDREGSGDDAARA